MKKDKNIKRRYIVFGIEHYNPLGIVRSLGEQGIYSDIVLVGNLSPLVSKSKFIRTKMIVKSIEEGFNYIIETFGKSDLKDILYSVDDKIQSYLDFHYDELIDNFVFFNAGANGVINKYLDKQEIQTLAEKCGFRIPRTVLIKKGAEIPEDIQYPIITKAISSITGGWKDDVFICYSKQDIINAFPKIKSSVIALQEYIHKDNELCLDGFSYLQGNKVCITIASTYDYILEDTYSPLMTITNFEDVTNYQLIKDRLDLMFKQIGFEGIFSIEFLMAKGELYFLEINFRNSTWSYASSVLGNNLPILWVEAMDKPDIPHDKVKFSPGRAVVEPEDFKIRVLGKKISLFEWIKDIFSIEVKYYWNVHDLKPFVSMLIKKINNKIKNR